MKYIGDTKVNPLSRFSFMLFCKQALNPRKVEKERFADAVHPDKRKKKMLRRQFCFVSIDLLKHYADIHNNKIRIFIETITSCYTTFCIE